MDESQSGAVFFWSILFVMIAFGVIWGLTYPYRVLTSALVQPKTRAEVEKEAENAVNSMGLVFLGIPLLAIVALIAYWLFATAAGRLFFLTMAGIFILALIIVLLKEAAEASSRSRESASTANLLTPSEISEPNYPYHREVRRLMGEWELPRNEVANQIGISWQYLVMILNGRPPNAEAKSKLDRWLKGMLLVDTLLKVNRRRLEDMGDGAELVFLHRRQRKYHREGCRYYRGDHRHLFPSVEAARMASPCKRCFSQVDLKDRLGGHELG